MLLAIDTASAWASVTLWDDGPIASVEWLAQRGHLAQLSPRIAALLEAAGAAPTAVTHAAAVAGPGSFSGIRVGIAAATGFALAVNAELAAVDGLAGLAAPFVWAGSIVAAVRAGRDLAIGRYALHEGRVVAVTPPAVRSLDEASREFGDEVWVAEPDVQAPTGVRVVSWRRRGLDVAALAAALDPIERIEPIYLRPPNITLPKGGPAP